MFLQVNPKLHQRQSFKVMSLCAFLDQEIGPSFRAGICFFFSLFYVLLFDILRTERMSCGDPRGKWQGCHKVKSAAAEKQPKERPTMGYLSYNKQLMIHAGVDNCFGTCIHMKGTMIPVWMIFHVLCFKKIFDHCQ